MDTPGLISTMSLSLLPSWADLAYRKTDENVTALKALYDINGSLPILAGTILLSATLAFVFLRRNVEAMTAPASQSDNAVKKPEERPYGEWTAVPFTYPTITPWLSALEGIKPVPYRPYRWGPYHITMGIKQMIWDNWIELDDQFEHYQRIRAQRISTRGEKVIRVLGDNPGLVRGGSEAAIELVHELSEYLSRRYPSSFHVTRHESDVKARCQYGWNGAPPIRTISVVPLNTKHELPLGLDDGKGAAERALTISALLVQDDLAIMIEGRDGRYYFQAGAICMAGTWRMEDKIGKPLHEIHISGNVPQYQEKLQTSLERFFRRLSVDKAFVRHNYGVQVVGLTSGLTKEEELDPEELGWCHTMRGPEDLFGERYGPEEMPAATPEGLRLRVERQTLRRLPKSGAVVFTIRVYTVSVSELAKDAGEAARLVSAIRSWPASVAAYKGGLGRRVAEYLSRDDAMAGTIKQGQT